MGKVYNYRLHMFDFEQKFRSKQCGIFQVLSTESFKF